MSFVAQPKVAPEAGGRSQAAMPRGPLGRLVGRTMAVLNADMERSTVDRLTLGSGARLLAVGFGPGVGVVHALGRITDLVAAGVDPSAAMMAQAQRRCARAGRTADLRLGTAAHLPWSENSFDAAISVNNIQFWNLPQDLYEIQRVLTRRGRLAVAVHASMLARHLKASSPQDAGQRLAKITSDSGFAVTDPEIRRARTGPAIHMVAVRP
jgi:arsenite methyltransferase